MNKIVRVLNDVNHNKDYCIIARLHMKPINETVAWKLLKPVCRELDDLIEREEIQFLSGHHNENNNTYVVNLKSKHLHFASRGLRDSIGDVAYKEGALRVGLRSAGVPLNVFVQLV